MIINFFKTLRLELFRKYYAVGIIVDSNICEFGCTKANNVHWLKYPGYKENWIADPFIYKETDDCIFLFAEQWIKKQKKGILVSLCVSRVNYRVLSITPLLELDTHLSFPAIIRENDVTYVYPESSESGKFCIYTYNDFTNKLENPRVLIEEPLLDVQIVKFKSSYYALGIRASESAEDYKILCIYTAQDLLGPYKLVGQINHSEKIARGAGTIYNHHGQLIRPAQDCSLDYGKSVIFFSLSLASPCHENPVGGIFPDSKYPEGLHTYNKGRTITVIDGIKYRYGVLFSLLKKYF